MTALTLSAALAGKPTKFWIYYACGRVEERNEILPDKPDYDQLCALLCPIIPCEPGYIERVSVWHENKRRDMFVHEEGKLRGLPRNEKATAIYRAWVIRGNPAFKENPEALNFIVGNAVLFSRRVWF